MEGVWFAQRSHGMDFYGCGIKEVKCGEGVVLNAGEMGAGDRGGRMDNPQQRPTCWSPKPQIGICMVIYFWTLASKGPCSHFYLGDRREKR